ncbi:Holliday junction branch migration protein RuvA [Betaproteobacteria bacterium]|nr:Holliday junction branch migration protein RuvA [Betaproteobacteria bacterium]
MINRILGIIVERNPSVVIVDVGGVGYEIGIPVSTFSKLPPIGEKVLLFTHLYIREDSHQLFGFLEEMERSLFGKIIKVSGIGPRVGLAILSTISPASLVSYIENRNTENLCQIPGIGKKTAERMILELNGKIETLPENTNDNEELVQALLSLGYSEKEVRSTVSTIEYKLTIQEKIKKALKLLSG